MKNLLLYVITVLLCFYLLASGQPLGGYSLSKETIIAGYRIAIALLLLFRLYRTQQAIPFIWGYELVKGENNFLPKLIVGMQTILLLCIGAGLYTGQAAILFLITNMIFLAYSKYYSIEDIYIQNVLFHLPFIGAGVGYSFDALLGIEPMVQSTYMLNSFFVSNALIMLSAGYEKIKSDLWKQGKGTSSFLTLPHLVKERFHFLGIKFNKVFIPLGYLVMSAEFLMLFSAVHPWLLWTTMLVLGGFALCLFILVDLSFIGQVLLLNLLLFTAILLANVPSSLSWPQGLDPWMIVAIMLNMMTATVIFYYSFALRIKLVRIQKYLSGINSPIGVFNEKHQFGFYTYRLLVEGQPVLEAFDKNGFPGKYQVWYPRYFQAAMYPVTDFCLGIGKFGVNSTYKKEQIKDLLYAGLLASGIKEGKVIMAVKKFDIDDTIHSYKEQDWTVIGYGNYDASGFEWHTQQVPPKMKKTYRVI